jgi:predicted nucleotidyltransferase
VSLLAELLRDTVARVAPLGPSLALVGGLAVSVRTEPRFTRDIDLAVAVADDAEAESVVRALTPPYEVLATLEHEQLERLAAVRLGRSERTEGAVVDLLFTSSGIEGEIAAAATPIEVFAGLTVPVARTGHLVAVKLLARGDHRPQDDVDLRALLDVAGPSDLELATDAVDLIVRRGAHRGRDLRREWEELVGDRP